jgi:hypothetical protein
MFGVLGMGPVADGVGAVDDEEVELLLGESRDDFESDVEVERLLPRLLSGPDRIVMGKVKQITADSELGRDRHGRSFLQLRLLRPITATADGNTYAITAIHR